MTAIQSRILEVQPLEAAAFLQFEGLKITFKNMKITYTALFHKITNFQQGVHGPPYRITYKYNVESI